MASEKDREADFEEAYKQAWAGFGTWQATVRRDLKVYLGDPWTAKDRLNFKKQEREAMSFPLIRRHVKLITGYQRRNRLSLKYDPVENADEQTAQIFSSAGMWVMQYGNGYNIISDGFEGCLITGINLINLYNDRNQNTKFDRFFYNQFLLDPNFSYRDLSDCHFGILRKYITKEAAKMILPGKESFIEGLKFEDKDKKKFPNFSAPTLYGDKLLAYDEWQTRTTKEQIIIIDRFSSKETEWNGSKKDLDLILALYTQLTMITRRIPTIEVTSYLQGHEVNNEIDQFGIGDFSFTPIMAFWHPEYDYMAAKLQSVVHGLVDSQRASDKSFMAEISMFEQQIGGGLDFEVGTLVDEDDAFASGQKPRQFKKDAISLNRTRDRQVPEIPASRFELHRSFQEQMTKSVNINEEMLGMPSQGNLQIAGVLAQLRMGAGLIGLQDLFDNLSYSQKVIGNKLLKLMQQYAPSRIQRITNQQPTQEFYSRDFGKYDAVPVEGVMTNTQRNLMYSELVQLMEVGQRVGKPVPYGWKFVLKFFPSSISGELMQEIERLEQQQIQDAQRQQQLQDTIQQLAIEQSKASLLEDKAQAEERRTQAAENTTGAALDRINTMVKIEDLRNKPVLELLKLAVDLEKVPQQNVEAKAKS